VKSSIGFALANPLAIIFLKEVLKILLENFLELNQLNLTNINLPKL